MFGFLLTGNCTYRNNTSSISESMKTSVMSLDVAHFVQTITLFLHMISFGLLRQLLFDAEFLCL